MYLYNFFQSDLWRKINKDIYKKSIFEITLSDWNTYWWVVKEKSKGILTFRWYQLLGVKFEDLNLEKDIKVIKRDFKISFGDIMFQFGFIDKIWVFNSKQYKDKRIVDLINQERGNVNKILFKYWLKPSFRENMPKWTVIVDLNVKDEDEFYKRLSSNARNHYNKWKKKWLIFEIASLKDWDNFYNLRKETALEKWFNIIPKFMFDSLKEFLVKEKAWDLFIVKNSNWDIVSGSICLFDKSNRVLIYLYWATNRSYWNIGAHQFLKIEMFKWAYRQWFLWVDLLWTPSFVERDSSLRWVWRFKWSLWGRQIEWWGSYDYIFNKGLYELFKLLRKK